MLAHMRPRVTEPKFRLLYVGADQAFIAAVQQLLTTPDYRLVTCSIYSDAVLFLRSEIPYDLLLIEFDWRGKEGLKLARLARSLRHRKRMPVVLVTATEPGSDVRTMAKKAGVTEWVMKSGEIGEAIRSAIH
jgi:CheY-like chemotaxis protein